MIGAALANAASAATAYHAVDLTPIGRNAAAAYAAGGGKQVGSDDTTRRAILWSGSTASATDLTPPGGEAAALAADATSQGGSVDNRAALWHGSASSFVDLHSSSGYSFSVVRGIGNGQQVGNANAATAGAPTHAALWSGAPTRSSISIPPPACTRRLEPGGLTALSRSLWHGRRPRQLTHH